MRTLASTAFVLFTSAALCAQDPPAPKSPPPSIDQLATDVIGIRAKRAELDKQEAEKLSAIAAELKRQRELLEKLGLDGPGPQPVPPKPVPPTPVDPLRAKLQAAFASDPADLAARKSQALDLAALWKAAATLAADESVTTSGQLLAKYVEAVKVMLKDPPGGKVLSEVRRVASAELGALLGADVPLAGEQRAAVAALFKALAAHLEEIAK